MRSQNGLFLLTCVSLVAGLLWAHSAFIGYFGQHSDEAFVAQKSERALEKERFAREMAEARLRDFAQEVATSLPSESSRKLASRGYEVRTLASVVREPAAVKLDLSGVRMEKAKRLFTEKKYRDVLNELEVMLKDFPTSPNALEAQFFRGEAAYLLQDEKKTLDVADIMVSHYPDHELTGFLLLRVGQINERNNRVEEAAEIYRAVSQNFKNESLVEQARRLSASVEGP